ncbi:UDP-glucuronosyltransferase 1A1-like isoform X2 [Scyliorhinus torazame]|uniref:UDP-glucuronosyltransferase 1A1-like isoform X2 n=1 Tax=Scyliorhinus torazame TaxID=75743 RepID=UPI003B591659
MTSTSRSLHVVGCLLFVLTSLWRVTESGDLLVVPVDGSHWLTLKVLMDELGRRGHNVVVVVPEVNMKMDRSPYYTTKIFPVPYNRDDMDSIKPTGFTAMPLFERIRVGFQRAGQVRQFFLATCESLLYNTELMQELVERKFDALLTDPFVPCGAIVADYLSLPTVNLLRGIPCSLEYLSTQCPQPFSYVPRFFSGNTDRMNFLQRTKNVLVAFLQPMLCWFIYSPFEELATRFLQREVTLVQLLSQTSIWLMRYDFVFESPRPLMPNMVLVGGINCRDRQPLSQVLWRYTGLPPTTLAPNTKLVEWLPQNDLMGHPKTRAFITHGGTNGIYEAICSGVPSVMLPLFGDQGYNVDHMVNRGAGVKLQIELLSTHDLVNALNTVINDTRYKETMMKLSALHKDRSVSPLELSIHWVEFVMRHRGAEHLRPAAHDLNWVQYHSLDVFGVLLVSVMVSVWLMIKCCSYCCKRCWCGTRNQMKRKPD